MTNTMQYDVAIIGGGIVGLATGMALVQQSHPKLIVLEAEDHLAAHQTGHNSGVIHSGIYYKPGSLKAKNCVEGRLALYQFCAEYGIPHDNCGKVIVATKESELPTLKMLEERGKANGLEGLRYLKTAKEIHEYEPHATGLAGLFVPQTGIVDYTAVSNAYGKIITDGGGEVKTNSKVTGIRHEDGGIVLETASGEVHCRNLINCAGLESDRVARMAGVDPKVQIVPFRGEYYEIVPERQYLVKNLVYPVPDPRFPFLGVHFTRMIHGGVEAGPNAVLSFKREGYSHWSFSARDMLTYGFYIGFWRMGLKFWKMGLGEFYRSYNKRAFVKALQVLLPELQDKDIHPAGAGVRAQALAPDGKLLDDFSIVEAPHMIHVLNAPSPAATASISIGKSIAGMAEQNFGLGS